MTRRVIIEEALPEQSPAPIISKLKGNHRKNLCRRLLAPAARLSRGAGPIHGQVGFFEKTVFFWRSPLAIFA